MNLLKSRWPFVLVALAAVGYIAQFYRIEGLDQLRIKPKPGALPASAESQTRSDLEPHWIAMGPTSPDPLAANNPLLEVPSLRSADAPSEYASDRFASRPNSSAIQKYRPLRVGSFSLAALPDDSALRDERSFEILVRACSRFDVLALQGLTVRDVAALPAFVSAVEKQGLNFEYLVGPPVGRGQDLSQMAFLFNCDRVETDRFQLYSVDDPQNLISRNPLVGWFRAKEPAPEITLTFTLVSIDLDSESRQAELALLPEIVKSILADGRREDDLILAGNFQSSDRQLSDLQKFGFRIALQGLATTVRGDRMLDNIIFLTSATREYNGRSGVVDLVREFNLTIREAEAISQHLPIGAEFEAVEFGAKDLPSVL